MEQIGLKAVMEMTGFTAGINKYNEMVGGASAKTTKEAGIMSKAFASIGKAAAGLAVGGIAAITTAMVAGISATTNWAEKLDGIGDVLGTTTEESAALAVAAQHIGGNVEQLTSQMAILTRGLFDAKGEIGPTGKVLNDMGIAFQDANGKMLPTTDILQAVADKIGAMPDGLEKTQLMMDLFGKSGKDMSDMMGVLANGGMEEMNQKAKDLGLSLSEEATQGAIDFNRSMNDLKMAGQGLLVTLGSELLPIIQPLIDQFMKWAMEAMPAVREGLKTLVEKIGVVWGFINEHFLPIIKDVWGWLKDNIPQAITTAETFFNDHLKAPMTDVYNFIKDHLVGAFGDVKTWLETNIPLAIDKVKKWVNKELLPAWEGLKGFIDEKFLPALEGVTKETGENNPAAVLLSKKAWSDFLSPTMTDIKDFWNKDWIPALERIITLTGENTPGAITKAKEAWESFKKKLDIIWQMINTDLIGPNGSFTRVYNWFNSEIAGPIWRVIQGPLGAFALVWNNIKSSVAYLVDKIGWLIEQLLKAASIKLPSIPGLATGGLVTMPGVYKLAEEGPEIVLNARQTREYLSEHRGIINNPGSVTNNNSRSMNFTFNANVSNGMDVALLRHEVISWVTEAIGA